MKQVARTKVHIVRYKGWTLIQVPWNGYGGKQYAKTLINPSGQERLHAGYADYCTHKQLRRMIRHDVDRLIPMIEKMAEIRTKEAADEMGMTVEEYQNCCDEQIRETIERIYRTTGDKNE